ncbi:MAG: ribonuclease III [Steroidobacteraceae bacterium]
MPVSHSAVSHYSQRPEDWPVRWVRARLGYEPRDRLLFAAALTHRSATGSNNERMEFLGDSVLNLLIAERLYRLFPAADEGDLSRLRARLVSTEPLAAVALEVNLGDELVLGSGELKTGGFRRESILADAVEAVLGAVFIDGGLDAARGVIDRLFAGQIAALPATEDLKDPKTKLQELLQARGLELPLYVTDRTEGEPHAQTFWVSCVVAEVSAQGVGSSRRRAEQAAAQAVLERLE